MKILNEFYEANEQLNALTNERIRNTTCYDLQTSQKRFHANLLNEKIAHDI